MNSLHTLREVAGVQCAGMPGVDSLGCLAEREPLLQAAVVVNQGGE